MEILNYQEQPKGTQIIAIFSVYIPTIPLTIHKIKLLRSKKGHLILGLPSFSTENVNGYKSWTPFVEFPVEQMKTFNEKVLELVQPFMTAS